MRFLVIKTVGSNNVINENKPCWNIDYGNYLGTNFYII